MPKRPKGLTSRGIAATSAAGRYADGNGLYLQVTPGGQKSWIFRYSSEGKRREMGLGAVALVPLGEARAKAVDLRKDLLAGIDPLKARRALGSGKAVPAQAVILTFRDCSASYIDVMRSGWQNEKHAAQWVSTLASYAHPVMGDTAISSVDTKMVLEVIEPIWSSKTETASRVRGRIEAILDWAKVRGYREGENPARWKGHLEHILPAKGNVTPVEHHASMPYREIPDFWQSLVKQEGVGAKALQLCILTATRSGEIIGAKRNEFDLANKVWCIPANRMKAGFEHRIPLPGAAVTLLESLPGMASGDVVFEGHVGGKAISNMTMNAVLKRMNLFVTPHGFRSTFRTWAAEMTVFQHEVCEAALAHTVSNKVVAAYQRGDMFAKRGELMAAWAEFVTGPGR